MRTIASRSIASTSGFVGLLCRIVRGPRRGVTRSVLLPVFAFAGGACATALGGGARTAHGDTPFPAVEQLGRVLVRVEDEYVDPVDRAKLLHGAVKRIVSELHPHASYRPPDEFAALEGDTQGEFGGIGIEVETRDDKLVVLSPIEGSPAERAGIVSGDIVMSVGGKDPSAEPLVILLMIRRPPRSTRS